MRLRQRYLCLTGGGQELADQPGQRERGPLGDLTAAEALLAENRLWLGPGVVTAFEGVIAQLGLCASADLPLAGTLKPGDPRLEEAVVEMWVAVVDRAAECEQAIHRALGLAAIDGLHERLAAQATERRTG